MLLFVFLMFTILLLVLGSAAEALATVIAGVVAPILTQLLKRVSGMSGNSALIATGAVSAVVALVALYFVGEIHSFGDVMKQISAVFTLATFVYKLFMAPTTPTNANQ